MADKENSPTEREKWQAELELKREELALKRKEIDGREVESRRARWSSPLVLAILGAILAAIGNIVATFYSGVEQRNIETLKHEAEQETEREKAESQLILEVIKTANPDKAAENLAFLVSTRLINDKTRREAISAYIKSRPTGTGVTLPAAWSPWVRTNNRAGAICTIRDTNDVHALADFISASDEEHRKIVWSFKSESAAGLMEMPIPKILGAMSENHVFEEFQIEINGANLTVRSATRVAKEQQALGVMVLVHPRQDLAQILKGYPGKVTCDLVGDAVWTPYPG